MYSLNVVDSCMWLRGCGPRPTASFSLYRHVAFLAPDLYCGGDLSEHTLAVGLA